jgi:hypothetical protein
MTRDRAVFTLALALGVGIAPAVADDQSKPSNCAFAITVDRFDRWAVIDDRTIVIEPMPGRQFKVTFVGSCRDAKHANFMRIERRRSSGACIGPGDKAIFSRSRIPSEAPGSEDSCTIKEVEALTPPAAPQPPSN